MKKEALSQSIYIAPAAAKPPATAPAAAKALVTATTLPVATEDKPLTIKASALANGQTLQSVNQAINGHGKVTLNKSTGNVVFTPDSDFSGIATFEYTLVDSGGVVTVHTATIDVAPVADAPHLSVTLANGVGAATKQGTEFLVNTTTIGGQFLSSVATYPDGRYVIAWTDTSYSGGDNFEQVRAQIFNADGTKLGKEFRVNTTTNSPQETPKVSVLDNGDFVVVWNSGQDTPGASVRGQVYHANGTKVGGEFVANTTQGLQTGASVTALGNGNFVVSWVDGSVAGDSNIKAQLFHDDGTQVTANSKGEFLINTITSGDQELVSVAALKGANSGSFVAVWQDGSGLNNDDTRSGSVKAQIFNADGTKVGAELLVDTKGFNFANEGANVTGLANGGFVVAWEASSNPIAGPDGNDSSIQLQIFSASGAKIGHELEINTSTIGYQRAPVVTELSNGDIVVAWTDESEENGDNSDYSVKAQLLDANGNRIGGEFLVNTNINGGQLTPSIAALPNGSFIVTWTDENGSGGDGKDGAVKAQIFSFGNAAPGTAVKLNIAANVTDKDGSETLAISVSDLPPGSILTDGSAQHSFAATTGNTSVNVTGWNLSTLTVTPPPGLIGDIKLTVTATATDQATLSTGVVTSKPNVVTQTIDIVVEPLKGTITDAILSSGSGPQSRGSVAENATNGTIVGTVQGLDSLPGAVLSYTLLNNDNGTFAIKANPGANTANIVVADGTKLDFESPTKHAVQVQVTDQTGASFVKTINIDVTNVNEAPTAETLSGGSVIGSAANGTLVGTVKGTDPDAGSVLSYSFGVNADGSLANAGGAFAIDASSGAITVANGSLLDFATATSHAIDVRVTDQGGLSFDKTFNITVTDPTKQFVAANELKVANEDNSVVIPATSLIADSTNPSGSALSVTSVGQATHGTVSLVNGNITFVPDANFSGIAKFDYTLSDASGHSSTATVTLDVAPVADAPQLSVSLGPNGSATLSKVGGEFLVNTTTTGGQFLSSVASFANGGFVVTWTDTSYSDNDFSNAQVRAQIFDADGHKLGNEFRVNTTTDLEQREPKVGVLANGDFVIAWEDQSGEGADASGSSVKAQMYHADGTKIGSEFLVNTTTQGTQDGAAITALANGGFVVSWQDASGQGGDASGSSVKAQMYHADGTKVGGEFLVNTTTQGTQDGAAITALANGGFVVTWQDASGQGGDASGMSIKAQVFGAGGQKVGGEFLVNTITSSDQSLVSVASLKSGGFVVTWNDDSGLNNDDTRGGSIKAQMFDASGQKVGAELLVDTKGVNFANNVATVTGLSNGGFVVSWEASSNNGLDTDDSSIQLQIFNSSGQKVGTELEINTSATEYQRAPVVKELSNGYLVVVWKDESEENGDTSESSIKAQVLDAQGNRVGGEFLVNTSTTNEQLFPSVDTLPNGGFIVTWTDESGAGGDASDGSVKAQIFSLGSTTQDTPVKLNLSASLTDTDSSETLDVVVSGIPIGALLTDGLHVFKPSGAGDNGGIVGAAVNTSVDISGWNFSNLTFVPASGFTGDFQLTVSATATDKAALSTGTVTDSKTISQTIDIIVAPGQPTAPPPPVPGPLPASLVSHVTGGTGNDVVFGGSGNDVLTGGGGNDTYQFGHGGGQDRIVNGTAASKGPSGELDFGAGINANQLWFQRNGNDLSIAVMGSHDGITVANWFGGAGAQLQQIKTADGMKIDFGVSQLVQAMASYSSAHSGFDPTTATQAPTNANLQNAIATAWHA